MLAQQVRPLLPIEQSYSTARTMLAGTYLVLAATRPAISAAMLPPAVIVGVANVRDRMGQHRISHPVLTTKIRDSTGAGPARANISQVRRGTSSIDASLIMLDVNCSSCEKKINAYHWTF